MEKLEPLLHHKFWIMFGVAVISPSIGWMMASGSMTEEVDKTWKNLDAKFADATSLKNSAATSANATYSEGLDEITKQRQQSFSDAHYKLRESQKARMVWPAAVAEPMSKLGYLQLPPADSNLMLIYMDNYAAELERVREIVTPYDRELETGLIDIPEEVLPRANTASWEGFGPTGPAMWEAQEDIWLLTAIVEAIARVNKDAVSIVDAPIKAVQELSLRGGSTQKAEPSKKVRRGPAAEDPAPNADRKKEGKKMAARDVEFEPADEFGSDAVANPRVAAANQGEDDNKRRVTKRRKEDEGPVGPAIVLKRYIDGQNDFADPSKTSEHKIRGFYLRVAMKNTFVPQLLAELSNMPYPVQLMRVQVGDSLSTNYVAGRIEQSTPQPTSSGPVAAITAPGASTSSGSRPPPIAGGFGSRSRAEKKNMKEEKVERQKEAKKFVNQKGRAQDPLRDGAAQDLLQAALEDQYLGTVVIAGTMTIYKQYFSETQPAPVNPSTKPKPSASGRNSRAGAGKVARCGPAQQPAATDDKKGAEKKGADATTNGK